MRTLHGPHVRAGVLRPPVLRAGWRVRVALCVFPADDKAAQHQHTCSSHAALYNGMDARDIENTAGEVRTCGRETRCNGQIPQCGFDGDAGLDYDAGCDADLLALHRQPGGDCERAQRAGGQSHGRQLTALRRQRRTGELPWRRGTAGRRRRQRQ